MPDIILWPAARDHPNKYRIALSTITVIHSQIKKKKMEEVKNIRRFPFASEESIIFCINNLPFPKRYYLT